jgi:YVTN family beta-propeller protein
LVTVGNNPNSGIAAGFGSVWVPVCGDNVLARLDLKTAKITARIPMTFADEEGGIAVGAGSVWVLTDKKSTLARIDPTNNTVVAEIRVAPGSAAVAFGENSVFVTSTKENLLLRVDPKSNLVTDRIKVGSSPRFLAVGEGSAWTLNQGDGSVTRVDLKSNKVVATIEVGVPGGGGEISVGEGSVWVTSFEFPITRIDPNRNRVVQQFYGPGGDAIRVRQGWVWLSNLREGNVWRIDPRRIEATRLP